MSEPVAAGTGLRPDGMIQLGRGIARTLLFALRSYRTHGAGNQILATAIETLTVSFNRSVALCGALELRIIDECIYFGEQRLRLPRSDSQMAAGLASEFDRRGLGALILTRTVEPEQVIVLLSALGRKSEGGEECFQQLSAALHEAGSPFVLGPQELVGEAREDMEAGTTPGIVHFSAVAGTRSPESAGRRWIPSLLGGEAGAADSRDDALPEAGPARPSTLRERCRRAFSIALAVHQAHFQGTLEGQPPPLHRSRRSVQILVDLMLEDESSVLGLTTLKTHDNYTFFHSVNVCVLSIGIGKRLGLARDQLSDLGFAALLHDLGKASVAAEILGKPGRLTPEERAHIELHPVLGVQEIIRGGGVNLRLYPAMVGAFEHHMGFGGPLSGYPQMDGAYRQHLYARVVAVADVYDALTTKRAYRAEHLRRDQVLAYMLDRAGNAFDPVVLKLLINLLGVFPVGLAVRLRSGRLGVVVRTPEEPKAIHRPLLRLVEAKSGRPGAEFLDLAAPAPEGAAQDEIVEAFDAEDAGIDLRAVFTAA